MNTISISQLKASPAKALQQAQDYPLAIKQRHQTKAYLLGANIFHALAEKLEDMVDQHYLNTTDFSKGKNLDAVLEDLNLWKLLSPLELKSNSRNFLV